MTRRHASGRRSGASSGRCTSARGSSSSILLALPLCALVLIYFGSLGVLLLNAFWTLDPFTAEVDQDAQPRQLRRTSSRAPRYRTITLRTIGDGRARDRHLRGRRVSRSRTTSRASRRFARGAARRRRAAAAVGQLSRQGLRVARHPPGAGRPQLGARAARASRARATATSRSGWCSRTSGCRT